MLLVISDNDEREPRFQIGNGPNTQLLFGVDADGLSPGEPAVIDADVFGYPRASLAETRGRVLGAGRCQPIRNVSSR